MHDDTCVIFGAGDYYDAPVVPNGAFIVAADGGLDHVRGLGLTADIVIGDFDSLTGRRPADGERTIALPAEKDDPDMLCTAAAPSTSTAAWAGASTTPSPTSS